MNISGYYKILKKSCHLIVNMQINNIPRLIRFYKSYKKYKRLNGSEKLNIFDLYPCINDDTLTTPFDGHYFYQGIWAFRKIKESGVKSHIDVGSEIRWVGLLSTITKTTFKACRELSRILAPEGNLYFSVPIGKEKVLFNVHRVHSPRTIIDYFKDLKLIEVSGVTNSGRFTENIDIDILGKSNYACGLFWFKKCKEEC